MECIKRSRVCAIYGVVIGENEGKVSALHQKNQDRPEKNRTQVNKFYS